MSSDIAPFVVDRPHCTVCNRPVEFFAYEVEYETMQGAYGPAYISMTGTAIVTVRCHGEEWTQRGYMRASGLGHP